MAKQYTEEEDAQLIEDLLPIGKAILNTARELAEKSGRPLYTYSEAVVQALIVVYPLITKDDPFNVKLREITDDIVPVRKKKKKE